MTPEAQLLAAVEGLMVEVKGLRADMAAQRDALSRDSAAIAARRKSDSDRKARSRAKSRDGHGTDAKPAESVEPITEPSRDSHVTKGSLKALSSSQDLDQEQEQEKRSPRHVTVTGQGRTNPVWHAYAAAYEQRYHAKPVRNRQVNSKLAQFVDRIGAEAPEVAAFYVGHSAAFYATRGHPVGLLLLDAEKLRTEWITGRQITSTAARQQERTAANGQVWESLMKGEKHGVG